MFEILEFYLLGQIFLNRKIDFELTCITEVEENKLKKELIIIIYLDFRNFDKLVQFIGICGTSPRESGVYVRSDHTTLGFVFSEMKGA